MLTGNWTVSVRFEVRASCRIFQKIQAEIAQLDKELDRLFSQHTEHLPRAEASNKKPRTHKNAPKMPIEGYARQLLGVDLYEIPGFGRNP